MSTTVHGVARPTQAPRASGGRAALTSLASIVVGLVLAVAVLVAPAAPASTHVLTAAVLLAFALGWLLLAVLSELVARQRQRWALVPAALLAASAAVAASGSRTADAAFAWVWPPLLLAVGLWAMVRVHRQVPGATARWLLYPVLAVLVLAAVGGGVGTVHEAYERHAHPVPGRLVDVGSHRLHLRCTGSGSPTVVVEPGQGAASADLRWIEPVVARDTTVCVYDRAGRGSSDDVDEPQDGARIAADLHTLLERAKVPGPYVVAGHSFGGLYAMSFAAQFPDAVAGLVLLDSTSPAAGPTDPAGAGTTTTVDRVAALMPALGRVTMGRDAGSSAEEWIIGGRTARAGAALQDLQGKPLLVLTAGSGHEPSWFPAQQRLTSLSTNTLQRLAKDTTHESLVGDEQDALNASQAITDVVEAVRASRPLASS